MNTLMAHSKFILVAAVLYQTAGCAPLAPRLDDAFGQSLNALKTSQTLNPQASANTENPTIDGRAAAEAMNRYKKSFAAPAPQQNVFTIGVGSGTR